MYWLSAVLLLLVCDAESYRITRNELTIRIRKRIKRDEEQLEALEAPAYELPYLYYPYTGQRAEDLHPLFPMTHNYNLGFEVQNNTDSAILGHANVPLPGWGIWDLHASIFPQSSNNNLNYGHVLSPVNSLNFAPHEVDALMTSPEAKKIKANSEKESVNNIPNTGFWRGYGVPSYSPLMCKPPICNPHTHTFVTGYQYQQGNDVQIPAKIDFPIPARDQFSPSYRYQLSMDPIFGQQPQSFNYGHHANGLDPWVAGFKPVRGSYPGNLFALKSVLNPQPQNTIPYVAPPLRELNIFEDDD